MEKKFSCYVFLRITEAIEVTQEINSASIIPLEALRAHLPKRPHTPLGEQQAPQMHGAAGNQEQPKGQRTLRKKKKSE